MKEEIIRIIKSPQVSKTGNFILRDGQPSNIYINAKTAYGIPGFLSKVSNEIHKIINPEVTCVAGMGIGGISLASIYGESYNLPICLIRDNQKNRGTKSQIEGYQPSERDKIVILDDIFTTGSSIKDTVKILSITNAEIIQACVILKRNTSNLTFPVNSILKLQDLK